MDMSSTSHEQAFSYEDALKESTEYFHGDDLAASVFVGKYALRNESNQLLEKTPKDMHRRLAKEFARIENKYPNPLSEEDIFDTLDQFRYIVPQGSPMSAIGNPYQIQSAGNCFVEGTRVLTKQGVKNIEDVRIGDEVVTHNDTFEKVEQLHKNPLANRQLIGLKCFRTPEIKVTDNHKFLSITEEQLQWNEDPQWNSVSQLRIGDYIAIPDHDVKSSDYENTLDIASIFEDTYTRYSDDQQSDRFYKVTKEDQSVFLTLEYACGKKQSKICKSTHRRINRHWNLDSRFAYFIGLWYGDGCVFDEYSTASKPRKSQRDRIRGSKPKVRGITFTFGSHEKDIIDFVSSYGEELFGIKADVNDNKHIDGSCQIVFASTLLGIAFENFFGRGSRGKSFNSMVFSWPREMAESIIQGLVDSDATITAEGDVRVTLASHELIESFYHLARSFGEPVGMSVTTSTKYPNTSYSRLDFPKNSKFAASSNKSYSDDRIAISSTKKESTVLLKDIDGRKFVKITGKTKLSDSPQYVYTLGVRNHHSYAVEGLVSQNCFVIESPHDSYSGILFTDLQQANLMKRRSGVGFDISTIRPANMLVKNAARTTDGISVFMERYSNTCREVAQNGRRGALMLSLSVHHPDVETFIQIKQDLKKVTGANISLRLTNEFMTAVREDDKYQLRWPVDSSNPKVSKMVRAKDIWDKIIHAAWKSAEPGLLFWDHMNDFSPAHAYGKADAAFYNRSTNPCGEIVMGTDSCRLLVLNLLGFVENAYRKDAYFNYEKFAKYSQIAQRLMDDVVDIELELMDKIINKVKSDPEPKHIKQSEISMWEEMKRVCKAGRRTGLGITALGDTLAAIGIKYGSSESIRVTEDMYKTMTVNAYKASCKMAKERGAFGCYDPEIEKNNKYLERVINSDSELRDLHSKHGRRNIALTTTAPTGSVSCLTQTTSGIEPVFLLSYTRRKKINPNDSNTRVDFTDAVGDRWQEYKVYHHGLQKWIDATGSNSIEESPYFGATSDAIDWVASVELQAAAQRWVCHSISKTCNLPNSATQVEVSNVYMKAWESGCKGFTVYRDGCRDGVLVSNDEPKPTKKIIAKTNAPKRPEDLQAAVHHVVVKGEQYFIIVGLLEGKDAYEVFAGKNGFIPKSVKSASVKKLKRGHYQATLDNGQVVENISDHISDLEEAITRLVSTSLRHGADINFVVHQLEKTRGDMMSFSKALARALKKHIPEGTKVVGETCASCGSGDLMRKEGCVTCASCGSSRCG
ncbi:MAG: adenosylcobalamin-dependent ribonucleoside-diphosphate reductase [Candidatus Competibacteraceae bacterium]|nr:adenosylcobalamin-dependent ribonucleoside-diphosphate reductase [Candidatus Competibacteraceae bacterium]